MLPISLDCPSLIGPSVFSNYFPLANESTHNTRCFRCLFRILINILHIIDYLILYTLFKIYFNVRGCRGRDRMVIGVTTT